MLDSQTREGYTRMSWLKKTTHKIAHGVGKAASAVTGSDKVGKLAEKGFKYATPALGTLGIGYQAAHIAGHLQDKVHDLQNPSIPAQETPSYPDYSGLMAQYMEQMLAAMNAQEPVSEPLKQAQTVMDDTRADTARKQLLRRGLMSTYTRYGGQGGTQRLGA